MAYMDLSTLGDLAMGLVIGGVLAAVGAQVVTQVGTGFTAGSFAANATSNVNQGIANLSAQFPLIGTIAALAVVVALLVGSFAYLRR